MARPKGSANKNKRSLLARLREEYGDDFHPIMKLARNCVFLQEDADNEEDQEKRAVKVKAANAEWSRMAEFVEPKLKAVEHEVTANLTNAIISDRPMTAEEWEEIYCTDE